MIRILRVSVISGALAAVLCSASAWADVSLRDSDGFQKRAHAKAAKPGEKPARGGGTGAIALTDGGGLEYFINSDITFSTTSSASGAASEASYVAAVQADTSGGGLTAATLNDAFDGYNTVCISIGAPALCSLGGGTAPSGVNFAIYNDNGPATADTSCSETPAGGQPSTRLYSFAPQTMNLGSATLSVRREVYVPANDTFARWTTLITNQGASAVTVNVISQNNLGSDSNTAIVTTSDGDAIAETTDSWVTSFQNFSGTTSSDPRLGHVVKGNSAPPANLMNFVNGDDNPIWSYPVTVNPGQTRSVMYYVAGTPTRAAAATKAAQLSALTSPSALNCMSTAERAQVVNFLIAGTPTVSIPLPAGNHWNWALLGGALVLSGLWFGRGRLFAR